MFALAIWDARRAGWSWRGTGWARSRSIYGDLPGGGLAFGSEPKALLAHPEIGRPLDPGGLARYLFYEYVPAPYSIWRSLRKLPRAHVLVWEAGAVAI